VRIGSWLRIRDADGDAEFDVVESQEADAVAERVSAASPLGRALLGRQVGDVVRFCALTGEARDQRGAPLGRRRFKLGLVTLEASSPAAPAVPYCYSGARR